jgi:hypothetical protein
MIYGTIKQFLPEKAIEKVQFLPPSPDDAVIL